MKKWEIKHNVKWQKTDDQYTGLINILLENRGIKTKEDIEEFLHPNINKVTSEYVGLDHIELNKTLQRLQSAFDNQEKIIVFGDYDVDGITGTAILWETLNKLGFLVLPYIPHRVDEGYGLSIKGIDNVKAQNPDLKLIITVDNGIVANEAVEYANSLNIDVIITDHHVPESGEELKTEIYQKSKNGKLKNVNNLPKALAIVHTTKLCGAGVAYLLSKEIKNAIVIAEEMKQSSTESLRPSVRRNDDNSDSHLELAVLGTIADLVPLTGANRTIVKIGFDYLRRTSRLGLQAIFAEAAIDPQKIGTYEVGFIIGPRLNAAGRIESAMDSLRLLCTHNSEKAFSLAAKLGQINRERQDLTKKTVQHALEQVNNRIKSKELKVKKILFVGHETYNPGVIGLVAGKLVEEFYRPSIVLSIGETHAKASVRSIPGVNIIDFLRRFNHMYVNVGGHKMAAGFTVSVDKMSDLQKQLEDMAEKMIEESLLIRSLRIDVELPFEYLNLDLYDVLQQLAPFGMDNPEPVFVTRGVRIEDMRLLGKDKNHLKLKISNKNNSGQARIIEAIGFGLGELAEQLTIGDKVDIAYSLDENRWNGSVDLQLKLKDISIQN